MLKEIKDLAKSKGMSVVMRKGGYPNSFTIFVYDKRVQKSYLIGFDGNRTSPRLGLEYCCNQAKDYILNYVYTGGME